MVLVRVLLYQWGLQYYETLGVFPISTPLRKKFWWYHFCCSFVHTHRILLVGRLFERPQYRIESVPSSPFVNDIDTSTCSCFEVVLASCDSECEAITYHTHTNDWRVAIIPVGLEVKSKIPYS